MSLGYSATFISSVLVGPKNYKSDCVKKLSCEVATYRLWDKLYSVFVIDFFVEGFLETDRTDHA